MKNSIISFMGSLALTTSVASANELELVTDRSDVHISGLIERFQEKTGITVNVRTVGKEIVTLLENSEDIDIVYSKTNLPLQDLKQRGLLVQGEKENHLSDEDGFWQGVSYRLRVFYVSNDSTTIPTNYSDLTNSQYNVCIRTGFHTYNIQLFSTLYLKNPNSFEGFVSLLRNNLARQPEGNDRNQIKGVYEGVCNVAVANSYYMVLMLQNPAQKEWGENTRIVVPDPVVPIVAGVGVLTQSDNKELASQFVQYILSTEYQQYISTEIGEFTLLGDNNSVAERIGIDYTKVRLQTEPYDELLSVRGSVIEILNDINFNN